GMTLALLSSTFAVIPLFSHWAAEGIAPHELGWVWHLIGGSVSLPGTVGRFLDFANLLVFFLFLRSVALAIGDEDLVASVRQVLIVGSVVIALVLGIVILVVIYRDDEVDSPEKINSLLIGMMCTAGILAVGWFIWYLVALGRFRAALGLYI